MPTGIYQRKPYTKKHKKNLSRVCIFIKGVNNAKDFKV